MEKKKELPIFKNMSKLAALEFDYEMGTVELEEKEQLNTKMYFFDKFTNSKSM